MADYSIQQKIMLLLNSVGTAATSHLGTMHYLPTIRFIVWLRHMGHIAVLLVVVSYDRLTSPVSPSYVPSVSNMCGLFGTFCDIQFVAVQ